MMKGISIFRRDGVLPVTIAVVASMFFVVMSASASTTISTNISTGGNVNATGTLQVTGATTLYDTLTLTGTGATTLGGALTVTGNFIASGLASSTTLKVGSDQVSTVSGIIFGVCNLTTATITATSTGYTTCSGATGVTSSYTVFVQATSSLPAGLVLDAASSTATTGTLSLRVNNANTGTDTATGAISINFWAVR
jgi:hypothetical protein